MVLSAAVKLGSAFGVQHSVSSKQFVFAHLLSRRVLLAANAYQRQQSVQMPLFTHDGDAEFNHPVIDDFGGDDFA